MTEGPTTPDIRAASGLAGRIARRSRPAARLIAAVAVLCAGVGIAWIDTRPGWDDTGITAGLLALATAAATLGGVPPLVAAALGAAPIVIAEVRGGWGVLLAMPVALAGAYAAALVRRSRT